MTFVRFQIGLSPRKVQAHEPFFDTLIHVQYTFCGVDACASQAPSCTKRLCGRSLRADLTRWLRSHLRYQPTSRRMSSHPTTCIYMMTQQGEGRFLRLSIMPSSMSRSVKEPNRKCTLRSWVVSGSTSRARLGDSLGRAETWNEDP